MTEPLLNWAANYQYQAARVHRPQTVERIQEIVSQAPKVKALGTRHSFNDIADTSEDLISLENLNRIIAVDRDRHTVTIEGGVNYGQLCKCLDLEGFALHNLASLPHISVAGACATATHGSGDGNGNLATAVTAIEFVSADGTLETLSHEKHGDRFHGAVVALGGLGVVTRLTLDVLPIFQVRQQIFENLPFERFEGHMDQITSSGYSVSLFTNWRNNRFSQVWVKRKATDEPFSDLFDATPATENLHPLPGLSAENCTEQMGKPGPWHERLPHFRMDYMPSSGEELQSEYLIPRHHAVAGLHAIRELGDRISPLLHISEVRTIAADELWMSPCHKRPCVAIHFTWKKDWDGVRQLLPEIEKRLEPYEARPHWGKLFAMSHERLQPLYERLSDFRDLLRSNDPEGKFRNAFLNDKVLGAESP